MYKLDHSKFLSEEEMAILQRNIKRNSEIKSEFRNILLIELIMYTGCRKQEALNVTWDDVNFVGYFVFIKGLKGSADREIPLPWSYLGRLEDLPRKEGENRVFHISPSRCDQIWEMYKPSQKGIKSLRHTFALRLYQRTRDIRLVQAALGHKDIANTLIYLDYVYESGHIRKVLAGLHDEDGGKICS